ncbi:MAG TPA: NAD(P)/FAD-dependent oxidoreductase [Candidatus Acidoferrales bacterium]|nr:NAD(P)/FAD-dependent oxidoreductase [Candidatus Acidoferrales bacterium]
MSITDSPEVVFVGGGIGGSALAATLAREGVSCAILEKSTVHIDHVRGEWIAPWGVAETQRLGLYETLLKAGGHHLKRHIPYGDDADPEVAQTQPLEFATFEGLGLKGPLCMRHPHHCDVVNAEAISVGVEMIRGVTDVVVTPGAPPQIRFRHAGVERTFRPRLVVGADGRNSIVRAQAGITQHRDPTHHLMTGMLVDDVDGWPEELQIFGTENDINYLAFPQSASRVRLYICYGIDQKRRFAGVDAQARFLDAFKLKTVPGSDYLANGTPAGPCNSYGNEDTWTDTPYAPGILLIGDAAGHNDPIIGQGLSITYRDVRIVRDLMLADRNWTPDTFRPYGEERAERMRRLRFTASLFSILNAEFGPHARERRLKVRELRLGNKFPDPGPAVYVGPEVLPPELFDEAILDRVRAM